MKIGPWFALVVTFTLLPFPSRAWDQKGHRVVAAIAWDYMDTPTRTKAVAILRGAAQRVPPARRVEVISA